MSAGRAGPLSEAAVAAFALGCAMGVGSGGRVLDILKECRASLTQQAVAFRSSPGPLEGESAGSSRIAGKRLPNPGLARTRPCSARPTRTSRFDQSEQTGGGHGHMLWAGSESDPRG